MNDKLHTHRRSIAAVLYASYLPLIKERAKAVGYAIAVHGSMQRDLDLIAIPWAEDACPVEKLAQVVAESVGGHVRGAAPGSHGRIGFTIPLNGALYVDLSVMPPSHK